MNAEEKIVDYLLWHACAGDNIQMPKPNSFVYYFPQGHAEHTLADVVFPEMMSPCILCKVIDVQFLVRSEADGIYAKIYLGPVKEKEQESLVAKMPVVVSNRHSKFVKKLSTTESQGTYLIVDREKAEAMFPPVQDSNDPTSYIMMKAKDINGQDWEFKHLYEKERKRHKLTAGWTAFVNAKRLVKGDTVIFSKTENADLRVGVIKARSGMGKVRPEDVITAASLAVAGREFEVAYYPHAATPEFVVKASLVDAAQRAWMAGMTVRMEVDNETWQTGIVTSAEALDPIRWPESPWRSLKVKFNFIVLFINIKLDY
ncbi:putative transcription factor ARF family [Helianthus annuus]|nr:putative transcription factor ARF family [Helianthus annuus]KAJ0941334.1 putative transcription factor ARF family [Helianthus annuus]